MTREDILDQARVIIRGDRENTYGTPEHSFGLIAKLWSNYLKVAANTCIDDLGAHDVAAMMILLKIARMASGTEKADNWVDIAGYAACGGEIGAHEEKGNQAVGEECEK